MKYVITWTLRNGGSAAENEEAARRSLEVFARWTPAEGANFHHFLGRLDGTGGFAFVEADDPNDVLDGPTKFGPFFEFHVYPVADIAVTTQAAQQAVEFRGSIS
ncbi:DUF3303 domain-containing protein [Rhodococcus sp. NPDC127530]|jgi:Domain of unknown function (DUF3303)|uniref:DUF3303 domain-containing protein n=1 Tax=unclassified Rhodococcus (in: high G+C Gram-positive bacteria) TaxID=192944 RepID=UPI0036371958